MFSEHKHIPSSGKVMRGIRSLTAKYILIGLTVVFLIAIFTVISFLFTEYIKNDATRVNIAGRERMLSFKMAWLLNKARTEKAEERTRTLSYLRDDIIPLFEESFFALRDGSEKYDLKPPNRQEIADYADGVIVRWQTDIKPLIIKSAGEIEKGENVSVQTYNTAINSFVDEINTFVSYLVADYEKELRIYGRLRISVLILSVLVFVAMGLMVRKWLVIPIIRLRDTAKEIEKGNFDVMLDIKSRDEIGLLTGSFNRMSRTLQMLFNEKLRHIKEVLALADSSNILNSLPMSENILETVCNVAVRNFDLKMAWIGIVEEGNYDVNPVAHAGSEEGYLSDVMFTWNDSPDGTKTTCIALRTKLPEIINDVYNFPVDTYWKIEAMKRGYRSLLSLPLISSEGRTIGVLNLYSSEQNYFSEERTELFHTFANQAAISIENRRYVERLEENIDACARAHEEIKHLYQNYEGLVNSVDGIVWEADAETFQFLFVSKKAEKILGYPVEHWLANPLFCKDHIHPEDREWAIGFCAKATSEKKPHELEYRAVGPDGRVIWLRNVVTVFVEDDKPVKLRGVMIDITNYKRSEEQIRNLSLAVEQSPSTVAITDKEGNIEYVNPRFTEITGYLPGEVIGKNPRILQSGKTLPEVYKNLWETITSGMEWRGEWLNKKKSGEFYWASVSISPIKDKNGKITHFLAEEVDITERKNAEEALREYSERLKEQFRIVASAKQEWQDTFDNITDLIFIHDRDYIVLRANRAFAKYFGLSPTEMIGKNCHELFFGKDSPVLSCPSDIAMDEGQEVTTEVFMPRTSRIFRMSSFPFYISERDVHSFICIARDITEEKDREMRLAMSERLATLGHVASGIAHEINNPLASIAGCAEGLLTKVKKGQYDPVLCEKYLNVIEEEILRCKNITTSMLSFARKTTYEKREVNINDLLDKTLEIIGFQGRIKDIEFVRNYKEDISKIPGSEGELRQVFLTIITNALDAMEDRGRLTIETGIEGEKVFIKITDTGPGIPSEIKEKIYDPFFTTKSEKGGTGLGLSIAQRIINNHNGNIDVTSETGKGTTFRIILPSTHP
ncbi:MAG: PAS domain S-box protein [Nitrospirota bacterium]